MNHVPWERWRLGVVLLATAAVAAAVVLHLVLGAPGDGEAEPAPVAQTAPSTSPTSTPSDRSADDAPVDSNRSADATAFARRAVEIVFNWDTTTDTPSFLTTEVLAVADPTGEETPGLLADLPAYVPDDAWWQRLREYRTRQWLVIDVAEVPAAWTAATAAGELRELRPGTTAVTIRGFRHRSGTVAGRTQTTANPVALTVFVLCQPDGDECRLLRLGAPGKVME